MYIKGCDNSKVHSSKEEDNNFRENFKAIVFNKVEWDEDLKSWVTDEEYWKTHELPSRKHYIHDDELGKSILEAEYIKRHGKTTRTNDVQRILIGMTNPTPLEYTKHTKAGGKVTETLFKKIYK